MRKQRLSGIPSVISIVVAFLATPLLAQNPAVTVEVDTTADRAPINPMIYGVAFASQSELADLNCPVNRWGGNATTRYNWQVNASNRAADWYFESIADGDATAGGAVDDFVSTTRAGGGEAMITVPTIGWVARLGANRGKLASFSVAKYGAQADTDWQWYPDAGNGVRKDGSRITGNDPADASILVDSLFQKSWVAHLVARWGAASSGGVRYYLLDNEPSIWQETHRDVHPVGPTMDEIRDRMIDYASKIKDADPAALVAGPEEWGWSGYFYSGYDQQYGAAHGWSSYPDRAAHGDVDYLPWLLGEMRKSQQATGRRLLDLFTVHYYPQGGEFWGGTSTDTQLLRNRSTRSLWDPNYVDESWIGQPVYLIPRMRAWISANYPGTKIGITEYNWGAEGHINGATAQADILGIFGRERLDAANRWTTPDPSTPTYKAMKMYRNYDGQKSTFGDVSVRATVPAPDTLSAFAAQRTGDGALTVMVVSKVLSGDTPVTVHVAGAVPQGSAEVWQLTSANAITRKTDAAVSGGALATTVPPQSITLFVMKGSAAPPPAQATAVVSGGGAICAGGSSSVSAALTGTAPWSLTWSDGTVQSGIAASPAVRSVSPNATTTYTLRALSDANGAGTFSGQAVVTVGVPPAIATQPKSQTIKSGTGVTLSVGALGSSPIHYQWYEGISGDASKPVGTDASSFKTPSLSSSRNYWVRVTNSCGAINSATATLSIRKRAVRKS